MAYSYLNFSKKYPDGIPEQIGRRWPQPLYNISQRIKDNAGELYLVGGAVIDILCAEKPKDWDMEVFGLSYEQLLKILSEFGNPDLIGNKFGIIKLKVDGWDFEFSIPRRESKNGLRHKDFDIELVPHLSIEEAAKRRDFTVNAIYVEIPSGKIHDPYEGMEDLWLGKLHYVNRETFKEDPLRVFRGLQIMARKLRVCTWGLQELVNEMIGNGDLEHLSGESILGELDKMMMKANCFKPAALYLERTGLLNWFKDLSLLKGCKQNPKHHPEGDAWEHTKLVMEEAFKWRDELPIEWRLPFMYGMLLHDIGKPLTTDPITFKTIGHDKEGVPLARKFMERLTNNQDLIEKTLAIVECHMRPRLLLKAGPKRQAWRRLQNKCPLNVLAYVSMADEDGRKVPKEKIPDSFIHTIDIFNELGKPSAEIKPILMGRHLIERGLHPGPDFKKILDYAYDHQLDEGCENIQELFDFAYNMYYKI